MTISELQKFLAAIKRKHGDLLIYFEQYSDYTLMEPPKTVDAVKRGEEPYYGNHPRVAEAGIVRGSGEMHVRSVADKETDPMVDRKLVLIFPGN